MDEKIKSLYLEKISINLVCLILHAISRGVRPFESVIFKTFVAPIFVNKYSAIRGSLYLAQK